MEGGVGDVEVRRWDIATPEGVEAFILVYVC